ncbi:MAG: MMPL family transporter [Chlamydiales bacterium]|nr:MMPL family transporter [Chlamydiales bacterium]
MNQASKPETKKGPLAFMARNSVTANLLMFFFLVGGLIFSFQVKQEVFPEFELDFVSITVPYPGAAPEEVEKGIILAIEEELSSMEEIKHIYSNAFEGMASITVELTSSSNNSKALQDIKSKIDRIQSFPRDSEKPNIALAENKKEVISLMLYGDADDKTLDILAENVRNQLLNYPEITFVEIAPKKSKEIEVSISSENLRKYKLTLGEVAKAIEADTKDIPAGSIKANSGEILLKAGNRKTSVYELENIIIIQDPLSSPLYLKDIAHVEEKFANDDLKTLFNHKNAIRVNVFRVGKQTPIEIADIVKEHTKKINRDLPSHIRADTFNDASQIFSERIDLLVRNAFLGLSLVLILLGLFLDIRLAFWVTLGIPISIIGSYLFLPITGASINMISLFAFIITLGIVVDDAVVVGESIYQKREQGFNRLDAAILGVREICMPVIFAVLTNIAAFLPLFFVPGVTGKFFLQIPAVVISVFLVSLIESLFILPGHLAHGKQKKNFWLSFSLRDKTNKGLQWLISNTYLPVLNFCMRFKYLTFTAGFLSLVIAFFFVVSGLISFNYLPKIDSDVIRVEATLPVGVPVARTKELAAQLENSLNKVLEKQTPKDIIKGIYTEIGGYGNAMGGPHGPGGFTSSASHKLGMHVQLKPSDERNISGIELAKEWRESLGPLSGVKNLLFDATIGTSGGAALAINLSHYDTKLLEQAAMELAEHLNIYKGVYDIDSGVSQGKSQINFTPSDEAYSLSINSSYLGRQLRDLFYGAEAIRMQRGRDEIKVMARLPKEERESLFTLEDLVIFSPDKTALSLLDASEITNQKAYESIKRVDNKRTLKVSADVDANKNNANFIMQSVFQDFLPELQKKYDGLQYSLEGQQREQKESLDALKVGFALTLFLLFSLLAVPFNSYTQPIAVLISIPFGIVGAIIGHILLGFSLSIISLFGIIALSGVVINDSLVLIVTCNRIRQEKKIPAIKAMEEAAKSRFRPIILTSLTTFFGLAPMIFETSMQARFLIPMAISIGFGILFATFIILLIVPSIYLILDHFFPFAEEDNSLITKFQ